MTMLDLTRKIDSLENKLDRGFQRIEHKLDECEKRLIGKLDALDGTFNSFEQRWSANVASVRKALVSGFASCSRRDTMIEQIAKLELDVERLKAAAQQ